MSDSRPRRTTILVSLTAVAVGAVIAGGVTLLNLRSGPGESTAIEVPVAVGYNGEAGRQMRDAQSTQDADPLSAPGAPGASSTAPGSSASKAPSSSSSAPTTTTTSPAKTSSSTPPPPPPPPPTPAPDNPAPDTSEATAVVARVNEERADAGCAPLQVDSRLTNSAQKHSTDMANRGYFSHTTPEGVTFDERIRAAGYDRPSAENIAKGQRSATQVMDGWMRSDGHRRNILNCSYKAIGVGLDKNGWLWTQNFGF